MRADARASRRNLLRLRVRLRAGAGVRETRGHHGRAGAAVARRGSGRHRLGRHGRSRRRGRSCRRRRRAGRARARRRVDHGLLGEEIDHAVVRASDCGGCGQQHDGPRDDRAQLESLSRLARGECPRGLAARSRRRRSRSQEHPTGFLTGESPRIVGQIALRLALQTIHRSHVFEGRAGAPHARAVSVSGDPG